MEWQIGGGGKRVVLPEGVVGFTQTLALNAGEDSPRLRYAGRPSLRLRRKEGETSFCFSFFTPSMRRSRREG
jgi:hypothetical protein